MSARHDRDSRTVTVSRKEWGEYQSACGAHRLELHLGIFYSGFRAVPSGDRVLALHPILHGSIPEGAAVGEPTYTVVPARGGAPKYHGYVT